MQGQGHLVFFSVSWFPIAKDSVILIFWLGWSSANIYKENCEVFNLAIMLKSSDFMASR